MPKRKSKKIKASPEKIYESIDWSINPQTTKEVASLFCLALGLLLFLSIFNVAGSLGQTFFKFFTDKLGLAYFIVPVIFLVASWQFWKGRVKEIKGLTIIGLALLLIFIPGFFGLFHNGGSLGDSVALWFISTTGVVISFILITCLMIISALFATNSSMREAWNKIFGSNEEPEESIEEINDTKVSVSVMEAIKGKFNNKRPQNEPNNAQAPVANMKPIPKSIISDKDWVFPPITLLSDVKANADAGNINKNMEIIQKTLFEFHTEVIMGDVNIGPTVAQYTLKPKGSVKLTAITSRANDLALALAARSIRIEAPIPGKSAVGIEIPNKVPAIVTLRQVMEFPEYKSRKSGMTIALGLDVAGKPFVADIAKMPHLLVAGSTGAGKSVAINGMILSLLFSNSPADLRMILVDPKRVEFTRYNGIPHLLTNVVTEVDKIVNTLRWTVAEMERRYKVFAENHNRNIEEYNAKPSEDHLPYIVVIIDELADLMMQAAGEVEASIVRISQLARATGIHLIVATQRPSVNVITGLIKANIATRIAFAVASQIDSRTILDQAGAEQLLGRGDMLFLGGEIGKPKRVQGVLVSEKEITDVTNFLKEGGEATYDESIQEFRAPGNRSGNSVDDFDDDLYDEAKEVIVSNGKASASLLQRRLRVGYNRAARLLDMLESEGVISPADGVKPRNILINPNQINQSRSNNQPNYSQASINQPIKENNYNNSTQSETNRIKPFPEPGQIEIQEDEEDYD